MGNCLGGVSASGGASREKGFDSIGDLGAEVGAAPKAADPKTLAPPRDDLSAAAIRGDVDALAALLAGGGKVDHCNEAGSPLICAAAAPGHAGAVAFLLRKGADANTVGAGGFSALHFAVMSMSEECVKVLVEAGASLDRLDGGGRTPLNWAEMGQLEAHAKIAEYLKGVAVAPEAFAAPAKKAGG